MEELFSQLIPQDLIKYGLIPELVGRIPVVSTFTNLDIRDLVDILTKPKNAIIRQYQKLFELEDVKLDFTREALNEIARKCLEKQLGARGLRGIIEDLMLDIMFHLPSSKRSTSIRITKQMVQQAELKFDHFKKVIGA